MIMKNKHLRDSSGGESKPAPAAPSRTKFTDEFKRMAVARLRETDNVTLLALELGIRRNQLYKWAKALEELEAGKSLKGPGRPPASEESEVARLRRELAKAQQELTVLKKFDAYLTRLKK
jgi:transposase